MRLVSLPPPPSLCNNKPHTAAAAHPGDSDQPSASSHHLLLAIMNIKDHELYDRCKPSVQLKKLQLISNISAIKLTVISLLVDIVTVAPQ